jgi:predicted TIM-barrel fold metal-dependent hydrolase
MATVTKPQVIAIEEHYFDPAVADALGGNRQPPQIVERLNDMANVRIKEMDEGGIDIQVLSHAPPAVQTLDPETSVRLATATNNKLAETIKLHPTRFAGFAALPTPDPKASVAELERCVTKLGFKGAMIHGLTGGLFPDDKRFWPIFEMAEKLDVPIYLHPGHPHPAVIEAYYKDYAKDYPGILSAGWGYTVEMATAGVRMVLSGVFDKHPDLNIILGHMGEGIPFSLWRIDHSFKRPGGKPMAFRDTFCKHFYITTSGNFSDTALLCSVMELGADRIIFSVDWPYVMNKPGTDWMAHIPLGAEDREKILNGNAKRLLKM